MAVVAVLLLCIHVASAQLTIHDAPPIEVPPPTPTPSTGSSPSPSALPPLALPSPVPDENALEFAANSPRLRQGALYCPCSFTQRRFNNDTVLPNGHGELLALGNESRHIYDACARKHGHEACVNWDAALVFAGGSALCTADTISGRNVVPVGGGKVRTVGRCDEREDTKSPTASLSKSKYDEDGVYAMMSAEPDLGGWGEGCVAVEHLHGAGPLEHILHWRRAVLCAQGFCATPNHAIIVAGQWTSMKRLCATAWSCTRAVKLVNNLSVFGSTSRRWAVPSVSPQIVVTPYDVRIPRPVTWALQLIELAIAPVGALLIILLATRRFSMKEGRPRYRNQKKSS